MTHSAVNTSQTCPLEHAFAPSFAQETPVGVKQFDGLTGGQYSVDAHGGGGGGSECTPAVMESPTPVVEMDLKKMLLFHVFRVKTII